MTPDSPADSDFPYQFSMLVRRGPLSLVTPEERKILSPLQRRFLIGREENGVRMNALQTQTVYMELKSPGQDPEHFFFDSAAEKHVFPKRRFALFVAWMGAHQILANVTDLPSSVLATSGYGVGILGITFTSPGHVEQMKKPAIRYHDRVNFEITPEQYREIGAYLKSKSEKAGLYNSALWNCSHFAGDTMRRFDIGGPQNVLGILNAVDLVSARIRMMAESLDKKPQPGVKAYDLIRRQQHPVYALRDAQTTLALEP